MLPTDSQLAETSLFTGAQSKQAQQGDEVNICSRSRAKGMAGGHGYGV